MLLLCSIGVRKSTMLWARRGENHLPHSHDWKDEGKGRNVTIAVEGMAPGTTMPHLLTAQGMCDGGTLSHDTGLWKTLRSKLQPCVCPNCCYLCSHFLGKPWLPVCVWRLFCCVLPNHPHWFHCCHNITLPGRSPTVVVPNNTRPSDRLVCLQDGRQELPVKYSKSQLNSVVLSVQEK